MARLPIIQRPATLRRELNVELSKALAHFRSNHPEKAHTWAERLIATMVRARILRRDEAEHAAAMERWKKS